MKFEIKCATFLRLAKICEFFEPECPMDERAILTTVRLEHYDGNAFAIVTNKRIAAIERIGSAPAGNGVAHVVLDPQLLAQCRAETFLDGSLIINTIPEIATAMASTSSGWNYSGNACYWWDETPLDDWRSWSPDEPIKKHEGIMYWGLFAVTSLLESSPSGKVYFPKYINCSKPVVLRDKHDDNWVGLFIPEPFQSTQKESAELPDWWHK